jgi:coenzyme F420-reducing hydrogenase delta subunit
MLNHDVTVFLCEGSGAVLADGWPDLVGDARRVTLPCGGRIDARHILAAVESGAREVYLFACPLDNCRSFGATEKAERRVRRANDLLAEAGSAARCQLLRAAANAPEDLRVALTLARSHNEEAGG